MKDDDFILRDNNGNPINFNYTKKQKKLDDFFKFKKWRKKLVPISEEEAFNLITKKSLWDTIHKKDNIIIEIGHDLQWCIGAIKYLRIEMNNERKKKIYSISFIFELLRLMDSLAYISFGNLYKKNYNLYQEKQHDFKKTPFWDIGCYLRYTFEVLRGISLPPLSDLVLHHEIYVNHQFFTHEKIYFLYSTEEIWKLYGSNPNIPFHIKGSRILRNWDFEKGGYRKK